MMNRELNGSTIFDNRDIGWEWGVVCDTHPDRSFNVPYLREALALVKRGTAAYCDECAEWEPQPELTHDWQKGEVTMARSDKVTGGFIRTETGWFRLTSDERAVAWGPTWTSSGRILCDIEVMVTFTRGG